MTYICNKGYRARGQMIRFCNETGNWTVEEPKCEGQMDFFLQVAFFSNKGEAKYLSINIKINFKSLYLLF